MRLFDSFEAASKALAARTSPVDLLTLSKQQQQLLVEAEATTGLGRVPRFVDAVVNADLATAERLGQLHVDTSLGDLAR